MGVGGETGHIPLLFISIFMFGALPRAKNHTQQLASRFFLQNTWCLKGGLRRDAATLRDSEVVDFLRRFRLTKCKEAQLWGASDATSLPKARRGHTRGVKNTSDKGALQPSFEPSCG